MLLLYSYTLTRYNMPMILRIKTWRITWRFLLVYFVISAIVFAASISLFFNIDYETGVWTAKEFGFSQILIISILVAVFVISYIPIIRFYYYIVEDKYFVVKRFGKEIQYEYKNIEFIDINESKRKGMVIFYSKTAKMRYMLGDKDGVLLETLIKKCPETMSVPQFRARHPEERY